LVHRIAGNTPTPIDDTDDRELLAVFEHWLHGYPMCYPWRHSPMKISKNGPLAGSATSAIDLRKPFFTGSFRNTGFLQHLERLVRIRKAGTCRHSSNRNSRGS